MHYLYFVKVYKDEADTAREAIDMARSILESENFTGSNGYWGGGKCDWFVMGGGWSGELSGLFFKGDFDDEVRKLVESKEKDGKKRVFVSDAERKKHADDIQSLWLARGGKNANPYVRDSDNEDGCDDDAVVLTADLITAFQTKYADTEVEYFDYKAGELKLSSLSNEDVGHWLVVVDYHF